MSDPTDFTILVGHQYYKVGVHNKLFRWSEDRWLKSERTIEEVKEEAEDEERRALARIKANKNNWIKKANKKVKMGDL